MRWTLEPGHTEAEFRARHMMVTWVRGLFKDIHGTLTFDPANATDLSFEITIDATALWTGEPARDAHLRSADFFDVENHPTITFKSTGSTRTGGTAYTVTGDLTMRGTTKRVTLDMEYLGQWKTGWWMEDGNEKTVTRLGFAGSTRVNRHDWGVSWNDTLDAGGIVVSDHIEINLDLEAYA